MFTGSDLDPMLKGFVRLLLFFAFCFLLAGVGLGFLLSWIF